MNAPSTFPSPLALRDTEVGRIGKPTGLSPTVEPVPVSPLRASIPSAETPFGSIERIIGRLSARETLQHIVRLLDHDKFADMDMRSLDAALERALAWSDEPDPRDTRRCMVVGDPAVAGAGYGA